MLLYHQTAAPATLWPEPIESTWQMLPGRGKAGAGWAFLLSVEPRSYVIVSGHVEEHCDSETWGVSLALDQQRGLRIIGFAEDGACCYPKSLQQAAMLLEAEFSVAVQKDVRHIIDKAGQTLRDLERLAFKQLQRAENCYRAAQKTPDDDARLAAWVQAADKADTLLEQCDQFRFWYGCLCDALELVDWRSGEIRDREINQRLIEETIVSSQNDNVTERAW